MTDARPMTRKELRARRLEGRRIHRRQIILDHQASMRPWLKRLLASVARGSQS